MINVITYNFDTSTHMFSFSGNLFFDDFLNKIKKKVMSWLNILNNYQY